MWGILALIYFMATIAGHGLLCRLPLGGNIVVKFILIGSVVSATLAVHEIMLYGIAIETFAALLSYMFICELYIFLFTLVGNSVSVSILLQLSKNSLNESELERVNSDKMMVNERLQKLINVNFLEVRNKKYCLTQQGLLLLKFFRSFKSFFRHFQKQL